MIIGITGVAGSGKDTAADYLVKEHGFIEKILEHDSKAHTDLTFNTRLVRG